MSLLTVILLMAVLPVGSILAELFVFKTPTTVLLLVGKWFAFWAVGVRQFLAGPRQTIPRVHSFHGTVAINASTAKMRLVQVAEEVISVLASDPCADVKVSVEIQASFPSGASDQTKRAVAENARTLGFKNADWE